MPDRKTTCERIAQKMVLNTTYEENLSDVEYVWDEAIQQTLGTALPEIVDKSVKSLLSDADFADKYMKMVDERVREVTQEYLEKEME